MRSVKTLRRLYPQGEKHEQDGAAGSVFVRLADSACLHCAGYKRRQDQFTLTFKVLISGEGRLRLIYHRTFERNVPPLKVFEITVTIHV